MASIQDPLYVKLCAQLASKLSISLASARRQVDQAAAEDGKRDFEARKLRIGGEINEVRPPPWSSGDNEDCNEVITASLGGILDCMSDVDASGHTHTPFILFVGYRNVSPIFLGYTHSPSTSFAQTHCPSIFFACTYPS